jgi:hypothetical protein
MTDAEYPVMEEATKNVRLVTSKKYATPLSDYNNDTTTTFADVQTFFHVLQDQLVKHGTSAFGDVAGDCLPRAVLPGKVFAKRQDGHSFRRHRRPAG